MRITAIALAATIWIIVGTMTQLGLAPGTSDVARGRYLTMNVAKCDDCHGPQLQGTTLIFLKPGLPFAYVAPRIAGLTRFSAQEAVAYLQTGKLPGGGHSRPPMPQYRFNHADAAAIVAYLKSIK